MQTHLRLVVGSLLALSGAAHATPSTVFWTPATTYVQPAGVPHLTFDTYFRGESSPTLFTGLTVGLLPFEKLQAEAGFDLFFPLPTDAGNSFQLNAKVGTPLSFL